MFVLVNIEHRERSGGQQASVCILCSPKEELKVFFRDFPGLLSMPSSMVWSMYTLERNILLVL